MEGGQALKRLRLGFGFTLLDVTNASEKIAEKKGDAAYILTPGRLSDIESKGIVPSIFKLYSLAAVYGTTFSELLSFYKIDLDLPKDHLVAASRPRRTNLLPSSFADNVFDLGTQETILARPGTIPRTPLIAEDLGFRYGCIGTEDFTMSPLMPAGSIVQIDQSKTKVLAGPFLSPLSRPIYFIETRDGYVCSWANLKGNRLDIVPHHLSGVEPRCLCHRREAEVIGQVVAFTTNLLKRTGSD